MSQPIRAQMTAREWAMLILLSVLWGGSFLFQKIAVAELPPFTIVLVRVALAALTLHVIRPFVGVALPGLRIWAAFAVMGLLNNVIPFSLLVYGQTQIGAGLASILNAMTPVFTVILAHFLTQDEKLRANRAFGVVLGFLGVICLIGIEALGGLTLAVAGQIACVGAAISYAFSSIWARRFQNVPPFASAMGQLTMSSMMMIPIVLIVDQPWTLGWPSPTVVWSLVLLAIPATALAYLLFFAIIRAAGATNIMLVTLLVPVSAVLLGAVFLGERLSVTDALGMALIGMSLLAIDGRILRKVLRKPA
ncbi:MAG: DMT family transporter [Pseudomonadota bacterium]